MGTRRVRGIAAGAALVGVLLAAPAVAVVGQGDDSAQPPPGTSVAKKADAQVGRQPAAGTTVAKEADVRVGRQPANTQRDLKGKPTTVVDRSDKGAKGIGPTRDRGEKNAPVTRG